MCNGISVSASHAGELQPPDAPQGAKKGGSRECVVTVLAIGERNLPRLIWHSLQANAKQLPRPHLRESFAPSFFSRCNARQRQSLYLAESTPCPGPSARDISCYP